MRFYDFFSKSFLDLKDRALHIVLCRKSFYESNFLSHLCENLGDINWKIIHVLHNSFIGLIQQNKINQISRELTRD